LPRLTARLDSDIGTVQLTLSLFLLSLAAAQLLLGPLSDRFGRRPVVLAGLALAALAALASITTASIAALIVARIVQAAGAATGIVIGRAIIRDLYERERAAAMIGLVTTAMVLAPMLAPTIGGLLDTAFGWEAIFLFIALISCAVLIWAILVLPETRPQRTGAPSSLWRDWRALAASRQFHGYVLSGAFGTAPFFIFIGGGPHVVVSMMGRSSAEYGLWFVITSIGYMIGNFIASRYSQRFGLHAMILAGIAIELAGASAEALAIVLVPDAGPALIFLPQVVISLGNGVLLPNAIAGAISVNPQTSGAASGITGFMQMAVGAAAAQMITVALAGAATPLPVALMILGAIAATSIAFFTLVRR
jgi:DHA1 family bicyclomycin/chloramphenicol resistance-like MFS transporter